MNGQLHEHPLAELIHEIAIAGLSGSLRLRRDRIKVAVYFEEGRIVYATSNLRMHRLTECARRWNVATVQRLAGVRENISDMELGLDLVAKGDLSREEFEELLARQAVEVLRPALLWTDGNWSFDPRVRLTVEVRSRVEVRELLMESARRLPPEFIAERFKGAGAEDKLSPAPLPVNGVQLQPVEGFILSRVDAPIALSELTAISAAPEADTLQALYALVFGGFLCRTGAPRAFTAEQVARSLAVKTSQARVVPVPLAAHTEDAPAAAAEEAKETPAPPKPEYKQNDVDMLFARLDDAANHYQVLDLSRDAEASEIKRAYHTLAKRFHPDRFHKDADPKLYGRIENAFARISQAYETLKDQGMRAAYDRSLGAPVKMQPAGKPPPNQEQEQPAAQGAMAKNRAATQTSHRPPPKAASIQPEEIYQQGVAALQQGNQTLALSYLGEASRLQPKQARYRAQYGRALALNMQSRRQAEAEFQAAIALDSGNAYYRVMLARLYSEMGMPRRAQSELERALSIDPQSQSARLLLDKLKGKA